MQFDLKKTIGIIVIAISCLLAPAKAAEEPAKPSSSLPMTQLMGVLSALTNNEEAAKDTKEKKGGSKNEDLKLKEVEDIVRILENKRDRDNLIKVMRGIENVSKELDKKQNFIQRTISFIGSIVESFGSILLNTVVFVGYFPEYLLEELQKLGDPEQRSSVINLLQTLLVGLALAAVIEYGLRMLMYQLNIRRPKEYTLRDLPAHVLRNIIPVLFFGVTGYVVVYAWQQEYNDITFKGYVLMTVLVMLRTSWAVLRVLFSSRHVHLAGTSNEVVTMSYQFIIATIQIILIGLVFAEIGDKLGVGHIAYQAWMRIIGFGVISLLIIAVWKTRSRVISLMAYEDDYSRGLTIIMHKIFEMLGKYGHFLITGILILSYLLWILGMQEQAWHLFTSLMISAALTFCVVWLRGLILRMSHDIHAKLVKDPKRMVLTSASQAQMIVVNFLQSVVLVLYFMLFFQIWGADPISVLSDATVKPFVTSLVSIVIILVAIRALWIWIDYAARSQMQPRRVGKRMVSPSVFAKTIAPILRSIGHWAITVLAVVLTMEELGISIMPIIYSVSFLGIAFSLGAQSLVKDLINGILTLMEGNISVGESVTIGSYSGTVESLSLRGVSLRHITGALQTIPFSEVTSIINKSRDYSIVPIEMQVPYYTDTAAVYACIKAAFDRVREDSAMAALVLDGLVISGVDKFTDVGFSVIGTIKVKADPRNRFGKAFNTILKEEIEREKLFPPHPAALSLNKELASEETAPKPRRAKK